jgi:hypothetical protein
MGEKIVHVEYNKIEIEKNFNLEQYDPNSFDPTTMMSYQLPIKSKMALKVCDFFR